MVNVSLRYILRPDTSKANLGMIFALEAEAPIMSA